MFGQIAAFFLFVFTFEHSRVTASEDKGFNPAIDYWRQVSSTLDYLQYRTLRELISQNGETPKAELEKKVNEWAKNSGLEQDFKIFTDIQRQYRQTAETQLGSANTINENEMSKIIGELATINEDQSISFKEACRRQNQLVKSTPKSAVETLGLQNLYNSWCE